MTTFLEGRGLAKTYRSDGRKVEVLRDSTSSSVAEKWSRSWARRGSERAR